MKWILLGPRGTFPAACWSESSCGTWKSVSGWWWNWIESIGSPTAWASIGFKITPGNGASSPLQSYTSWSSCVPRFHPSTQPLCSQGVLLRPRHAHISMPSTVASGCCVNTRPDSRQSREDPKGEGRRGKLPRKPLCVTVTEAGDVGCVHVKDVP